MAFRPGYRHGWAVVIGINNYEHASPLMCARQDAEAVAAMLRDTLGFDASRVRLLVDQAATAAAIRTAFLSLTGPDIGPDDKVVVFFAGHGHTRLGRRGEVGYLVPADGDAEDPATLIRWDELTRNADLIPAKHAVFIMDACYGGLVLTRAPAPGSMRFLKDMLQRYSRQVITAGKADEVVSDSGGPREGHSVFTGHLLDAVQGGAASNDGVVLASGVMAYVYDRVAKDLSSRQTPHYGFFDGDGDFVFKAPNLDQLTEDTERDSDILVQVPAYLMSQATPTEASLTDRVKGFLSDPAQRIHLDDLVNAQTRKAVSLLDPAQYTLDKPRPDSSIVADRIAQYTAAVSDLAVLAILLGRWGGVEHARMLGRIMARLTDLNGVAGGMYVWIGLRWYPLTLLYYYSGIAALSADNWPVLGELYKVRSGLQLRSDEPREVFAQVISGIGDADSYDAFKLLSGHERHLAPRSELLFKELQPLLDDHLFLGSAYEDLFDRFEVVHALQYAGFRAANDQRIWGPPGRFAWKYRHRRHHPLAEFEEEASTAGPDWPFLQVGVFRRGRDAVLEVTKRFREEFLDHLGWY